MPLHDIRGAYCPMGCGQTIHLMGSGMLGCVNYQCPDKGAAQKVLSDAETEHVVVYKGGTCVVRHPLRERIGDALVECEVAAAVFALSQHPEGDGRYRATVGADGELALEEVQA